MTLSLYFRKNPNSDGVIRERTAGKGNIYEQRTNRTVCIGALRQRFIELCLAKDPTALNFLLQGLYNDISKSVSYIGKSKPRPRNKRDLKNSRRHYTKPLL